MSVLTTHTDFRTTGQKRMGSLRFYSVLSLLLLVLSLTPGSEVIGQAEISHEYQIKGAFLFNFAQFVDWPPSAFQDPNSPLVIGILGNDPFGRFLDELVKGERAGVRRIVVKRFGSVTEVQNVQILFISASYEGLDPGLFDKANRESILTISEAEDFTAKGGMVKLFKQDNKIKFEINLDATRQAGIVFSSKVIRLAQICCTTKGS